MVNYLDTISAIVKMCTSCHQEKFTPLFHLKGADKAGQTRYQSICKDCANARRGERYQKKKAQGKDTYPADCGRYAVVMFCHQNGRSAPNLTEVMDDYIEAVYANGNRNISQATN